MKRLLTVLALFCLLVAACALEPSPVSADSGHARIVRLSLIQGDVRYAREFHKDALDDAKAVWEPAPLNLPIREGFALATDGNGRAEVEFENGAMAFLSANTVVEFYDLSLDDGALVTRLILRQGSAIFYVHPGRNDFFSVTGGDFSVEANGRTRFRLDNFDDGSTVSVEQGQVSVLHDKQTKSLEKGQSYSVNVNDKAEPVVARAPEYDDFDKWVSGRVDSVVTATTYSQQYVNSPNYSSGFADLYNYGGWYGVPGYGFCWQPYGVGMGWNPFGFGFGSWGYDPFFGWGFIGSAPWGWLPYHYGGWVLAPGLGWVWAPSGFGPGGRPPFRPVTAVWIHNGGVTGVVPTHPLDTRGKTPINLSQGVYAVHGNSVASTMVPATGEKWSVIHRPSREALTANAATPAPPPTKVSRTILSSNSGSRAVTFSRDSSIVYDAGQHRFVNNGDPTRVPGEAGRNNGAVTPPVELGKQATRPAGGNGPMCNGTPCVAPNTAMSHSAALRTTVASPPHPPSHTGGGWIGGHSSGSGGSSGGSISSGHSSSSGGGSHASGGGGGGGHSSGGGHH
jgi:hypothetical protein